MKTSQILIVLIIIQLTVNAQKAKLDSLENVLKTTKSDLQKVKALNILSFEYLFTDTAKANACVKQLQLIAETSKELAVQAEANRALGDQYADYEDYKNTLFYYNKALKLFKQVSGKDGKVGYARTLLNSGWIPHSLGDFNEALNIYSEAEPILEQYNEVHYLINLYNKKTDVYERMNLKEKALIYAQKAIKLSEKTQDYENIVRSYYTYMPNSNISQQNIIYLQKAKEIIEKRQLAPWLLFYYYHNYGGELYKLKKYQQALEYYQQADKHAFDQVERLCNQLAISNIYIALKDVQRSQNILNMVYLIANQSKLKVQIRDALIQNVTLDSLRGDYRQAFIHLQKKNQINDEIFSRENQKRIDFLNAKYDATRKEDEIQKLNDEKTMQEAKIHQKNTMNYAFACGFILLTVMSIFIYRNQQQNHTIAKQKIKELENEKQLIATQAVLKGETDERTRLARDLHDGLGGLLSGTKLILDNMKGDVILTENGVQTYNNALKLLDTSIAELRRVAYNMMPENLISKGLQVALEEFCNSLNNSCNTLIQFSFYGTHQRFDANLEIVTFRIAQELLNNALKHSEASEINVQLVQEPDRISLTVQDNGCGFDTAKVNDDKSSGLRNIRSRVLSFDGQFHLDAIPQKGTEAIVEFLL
jgi:signal transduction histidine kinase